MVEPVHPLDYQSFNRVVREYYQKNGRSLPWRNLPRDTRSRFYQVLVSEMMLQQTQVGRVVPCYIEWLERFPSVEVLASATFDVVLASWQGLGYNRRARYTHEAAQRIAGQSLPRSVDELVQFSGIGANTAGAIIVYMYNKPSIFVETNIRTVYLHHFFSTREDRVKDQEIAEILGLTMDTQNPREWYWALMDYGAHLKRLGKKNHLSATYHKQSQFVGSRRELRAKVLRRLLVCPASECELQAEFADERLHEVLSGLIDDRLIETDRDTYKICG
jgi:A/G-specific adenine glycosylase